MPTIDANASVETIARILQGAAAVGRDRWAGHLFSGARMASDSGPDISTDLANLFQLLDSRGLPYLLVGGVALLRYIDGRNTEDIDLVLSLESLRDLPEITLRDENANFARGLFGSVRVDLWLTTNPLFKFVFEEHVATHAFNDLAVRVATVEGLLILKFYALPALYRQGDWQRVALYEADITMLCQRYHPEVVGPILAAVCPFVTQGEFAELEKIYTDIQQRINRMQLPTD